jgi:hypothetical protein
LFDRAGQREIHIVAAKQDVLSDGDTVERQLPSRSVTAISVKRSCRRRYRPLESGRRRHAVAPVGMALNPGVES